MSDEIRAEIKTAAKALCHYQSGPSDVNSCCPGIGRCEMDAAITEITRLRAGLATARREGMETMAGKIAGWHEARAEEWDDQENKFKKLKTINSFTSTTPGSDGLEFARQCAQAAAFHRQRAAAIRAAAKEGKP